MTRAPTSTSSPARSTACRSAVAAGQYHIAEQARIEAYAFFELGPEQRLRGLAPELFARSEGLFWYGAGSNDGLATLINGRGSPTEIAPTASRWTAP